MLNTQKISGNMSNFDLNYYVYCIDEPFWKSNWQIYLAYTILKSHVHFVYQYASRLRNIASRLGLNCPRPRLQTANQARRPVGPRDWLDEEG